MKFLAKGFFLPQKVKSHQLKCFANFITLFQQKKKQTHKTVFSENHFENVSIFISKHILFWNLFAF